MDEPGGEKIAHKCAGHPQECEYGVDGGERQSAGAGSATPEEREASGEFDDGGEIGERLAEGDVGADALPLSGEVARSQAEKAEEDGAAGVGVDSEIGC